jgi:nicotinamide-nucleotide amidase
MSAAVGTSTPDAVGDGPRRIRAALLSVGSELLLGDLTDTTATWMSVRLRERGVDVRHHVAVGDDLDAIVDVLRWLADRVDLVVVGGGLGPTSDDLTREAVAAAAGLELEHREELEEAILARFVAMGRPMAPRNRRQARVPVGATAWRPAGTAPAFAVDLAAGADRRVRVVALPGVPWEAQQLWDEAVGTSLDALGATGATVTRTVRVVGLGESQVAAVVEPMAEAWSGVTLAFLARRRAVHVRLTATGSDVADARRRTQPAVDAVVAALSASVVGVDEDDLETLLLGLLAARGETLALAESATAGAISSRLADVPGASRVLVGSLVVYADAAKTRLAGLDAGLVAREGAVSAQVTAALARAARERAGADWGLAVTGVAGPGAVEGPDGVEVPVGTCHWAVATPDGEVVVEGHRLTGDRPAVRERLGSAALDLLRRTLSDRVDAGAATSGG